MLGLGGVSIALVVWLASRMRLLDSEGSFPCSYLFPGVVSYLVWLFAQIVTSSVDVTRRILDPELPIEPLEFYVPASQSTDTNRVVFANSITLTPGTVSMGVNDGKIHVHALTRKLADELLAGEMDRRVTALERKP